MCCRRSEHPAMVGSVQTQDPAPLARAVRAAGHTRRRTTRQRHRHPPADLLLHGTTLLLAGIHQQESGRLHSEDSEQSVRTGRHTARVPTSDRDAALRQNMSRGGAVSRRRNVVCREQHVRTDADRCREEFLVDASAHQHRPSLTQLDPCQRRRGRQLQRDQTSVCETANLSGVGGAVRQHRCRPHSPH